MTAEEWEAYRRRVDELIGIEYDEYRPKSFERLLAEARSVPEPGKVAS